MSDAIPVLKEFGQNIELLHESIVSLTDRVVEGEFQTENGISFLDVKIRLLLEYLMSMGCYFLKKLEGNLESKDQIVLQLFNLRTCLEKIRPIDVKLKYQVDKLRRSAVDLDDPLNFKPNLDDLEVDDEGNESNSDSDDQKVKKYKPPMLEAVYYPEKEIDVVEKKKKMKKSDVHLLSDLRAEFSDKPMLSTVHGVEQAEISDEERERTKYEEDNFVRLPVTRKLKNKRKEKLHAYEGRRNTLADEFADFRTDFMSDERKQDKRPKTNPKPKKRRDL